MLKTLICIALLIIPFVSDAQNKKRKVSKYDFEVPVNSWHFRVTPFTIVDPTSPTLTIGTEYRLKERLALGVDLGYILVSTQVLEQKSSMGINIRPSLKYYTSADKRIYVAAEFMYKQIDYKMFDWLGYGCVNNVPAFFELKDFNLRTSVVAGHFKIGRVQRLSKKGDKVGLDVYTGWGLRYRKNKPVDEAEDACYLMEDPIGLGNDSQPKILPSLRLGMRLLIKL